MNHNELTIKKTKRHEKRKAERAMKARLYRTGSMRDFDKRKVAKLLKQVKQGDANVSR